MCHQCNTIPFRKRFFADFMAKDDTTSYLQYKDKKEELFKNVKGKVLEIGPGTGVNLRFLSKDVQWIGIEPNQAMHPYLQQQADRLGINADLHAGTAEYTGLPDNTVDYVISTIVLCSVNDVNKTLQEIKRVLKPGGKFIFLEHQADTAWTFRWVI